MNESHVWTLCFVPNLGHCSVLSPNKSFWLLAAKFQHFSMQWLSWSPKRCATSFLRKKKHLVSINTKSLTSCLMLQASSHAWFGCNHLKPNTSPAPDWQPWPWSHARVILFPSSCSRNSCVCYLNSFTPGEEGCPGEQRTHHHRWCCSATCSALNSADCTTDGHWSFGPMCCGVPKTLGWWHKVM